MKKRKHHYVWKKYLKPWVSNKNQIYCCGRKNQIFLTSLENIGQIRDFYKLEKLNNDEIEFIQTFIHPDDKLNQNWLLLLNASTYGQFRMGKNQIDNKIDILIHNTGENIHSHIETGAIKYIDSILAGNIDFLQNDEDRGLFTLFIFEQMLRTKKKLNTIKKRIEKKNYQDNKNINISNVWKVLPHIFATSATFSLLSKEQFRFILIRNKSEVSLITGDQPVINTYRINDYEEVHDLEIYYPVSPKLALLLSSKEEYRDSDQIEILDEKAKKFNRMIFDNSEEQIYGNSEEILKATILNS